MSPEAAKPSRTELLDRHRQLKRELDLIQRHARKINDPRYTLLSDTGLALLRREEARIMGHLKTVEAQL